MKLIEQQTNILVESLLDKEMKKNIIEYLFWVVKTESLQATIDFIDFLKLPDVEKVLRKLSKQLFIEIIDLAYSMKHTAELKEL